MPDTTPSGLPYPLSTDPLAEGAQAIQNLAEAIDPRLGLLQSVVYTSSGTFTKANYPTGTTVRVRVVGGGGGGGGAGATKGMSGSGGGGGGYVEGIIPMSALAATETVTVGTGGTGAGGANRGTAGGTSSFGTHMTANGGGGGPASAGAGSSTGNGGAGGGSSADETVQGAIRINGGRGGRAFAITGLVFGGRGGDSHLGYGGVEVVLFGSGNGGGANGQNFGGGAGGAVNAGGGNTTGGDGARGIVIVEVYG